MFSRGSQSVWRTKTKSKPFEQWKLRVWLLRARMLSFIQQVLAFVTSEVIEPNWRTLERKLDEVRTVDVLLREHVDFLDTVLKECMLTNATMIRVRASFHGLCLTEPLITSQIYQKILLTCFTFTTYQSSFTRQAARLSSLIAEGKGEGSDGFMSEERAYLARFEDNFDVHIRIHLDNITVFATSENTALLALVVRLSSLSKKASLNV